MEGILEPSQPLLFEKVNLESVVLSKFWVPILPAAAVALTQWEYCRLSMWDNELVSVNLNIFPKFSWSLCSFWSEPSEACHWARGLWRPTEGSGARFWKENTAMDTFAVPQGRLKCPYCLRTGAVSNWVLFLSINHSAHYFPGRIRRKSSPGNLTGFVFLTPSLFT